MSRNLMSVDSEFDRFDYRYYDEEPLRLDQAAKKADQLSAEDPNSFYRVVPTDDRLSGFRIEKIPTVQLYFDFIADMTQKYARFLSSVGSFSQTRRHK